MREYKTSNGTIRYAGDVTAYDPRNTEIRARKRGFQSKGSAFSWEELTAALIRAGKWTVENDSPTSVKRQALSANEVFEKCVLEWKSKGEIKGSTLDIYIGAWHRVCSPVLGEIKWSSLQQEDIDAVLAAEPTQKHKFGSYVLSKVIKTGKRLGHKTTDIEVYLPRGENSADKDVEFLSPTEWAKLLQQLDSYNKQIAILMISTGIRSGEMVGLQWADVDFKRKMLTISRTLARNGIWQTPKNGRTRQVPLSSTATAALKSLASQRMIPPYIVCDEEGCNLTYNTLWRRLSVAASRAGLEGFHPHLLRHTAACWAVQAGTSPEVIRDLLGHSTIDQTMKYIHATSQQVRDAAETISTRVNSASPCDVD